MDLPANGAARAQGAVGRALAATDIAAVCVQRLATAPQLLERPA